MRLTLLHAQLMPLAGAGTRHSAHARGDSSGRPTSTIRAKSTASKSTASLCAPLGFSPSLCARTKMTQKGRSRRVKEHLWVLFASSITRCIRTLQQLRDCREGFESPRCTIGVQSSKTIFDIAAARISSIAACAIPAYAFSMLSFLLDDELHAALYAYLMVNVRLVNGIFRELPHIFSVSFLIYIHTSAVLPRWAP